MAKTRTIYVDDSGWGFPLGGVLCGVYDNLTEQFHFGEVETKYFQGLFASKEYLTVYADRVCEIITEKLKAKPRGTSIVICTGYVNEGAAERLEELGFKVRREAVGEPLQTTLETYHKGYVNKLGFGGYYDPKETPDIPRAFHKAIDWAVKNRRLDLLKSGWGCFKKPKYRKMLQGRN